MTVHPGNPKKIYIAGKHGVQISADDRRSPLGVLKIAYSTAGGGTFFMGTTGGLYRKLQGGTFTLVRGAEGQVINDVEVVYHNSDCIVVCASYGCGAWSMKYVPELPFKLVKE
jgi:hypothetical protein